MKKSFSTKVRSAAIAAVTVLGLGLGAGAAAAQPALPPLPAAPALPGIPAIPGIPNLNPAPAGGAKQVVAFGDSFTANAGKSGPRGLEPGQTPIVANCATDMENWPKIAAHQAGKSLGDWSCNGMGGAPVVQLVGYVEAAIMHGDIAPGTQDVVFMYGGMDALQWVDVAGEMQVVGGLNPSAYQQELQHVANRIREVAPGAQIHLASYPEYATNDQLCLVNLPGQTIPIPAPGGTQIQEAFRDTIRNAAGAIGANFIDVYQATIGHGTCNPDDNQRFVAGFMDPAMGPMTNHPTIKGQYAMADIIAPAL